MGAEVRVADQQPYAKGDKWPAEAEQNKDALDCLQGTSTLVLVPRAHFGHLSVSLETSDRWKFVPAEAAI